MLSRLHTFALQPCCCGRLLKHTLPRQSRTGACRSQFGGKVMMSIQPQRLNHDQSKQKGDPKLIGHWTTNKKWALYFAGISLAIVVAAFIRKKRQKKIQKEIFEDQIEYVKDKDAPFPEAIIYGGFILPTFVKGCLKEIKEFSLRDDDVIVVSFPKSGTTWMQAIVYLIKEGADKEIDTDIDDRIPYIEYVYPGIRSIAKRKGPRLIKTHMPYPMLPDDIRCNKGKIIYVTRNPKDVVVSYYHFVRMLTAVNYRGTFKQFFDQFIKDNVSYGPWWKHVAGYYLHKNDENILIMSYEELHMNLVESIGRVAEFLGKKLTDQEKLRIGAKVSFSNMASNPMTNLSWWDDTGLRNKDEAKFFRKGKVGDWQNYMDDEMSQKVEDVVERYLQPLGCQFTYKVDKS